MHISLDNLVTLGLDVPLVGEIAPNPQRASRKNPQWSRSLYTRGEERELEDRNQETEVRSQETEWLTETNLLF